MSPPLLAPRPSWGDEEGSRSWPSRAEASIVPLMQKRNEFVRLDDLQKQQTMRIEAASMSHTRTGKRIVKREESADGAVHQ